MRTAAAPAKLNLALHITGRRADGYHLLDTLVVFTRLADQLSVQPAPELSLQVEGPFAHEAGSGEGNLVLKAARLLQQHTGCTQGAAITLDKHVPVGAGLGGGSSDAAAALRLLNALWELGLTDAQLCALAPQLGADVAMCLHGGPLIATGIGEVITPVPAPFSGPVLLVHPRKKLLTAEVYAAYQGSSPGAVAPLAAGVNLAHTRNMLQRAAISLMPEVAEILLLLETATQKPLLARMTGSGACCFALYDNEESAQAVAHALAQRHPDWWVAVSSISA